MCGVNGPTQMFQWTQTFFDTGTTLGAKLFPLCMSDKWTIQLCLSSMAVAMCLVGLSTLHECTDLVIWALECRDFVIWACKLTKQTTKLSIPMIFEAF